MIVFRYLSREIFVTFLAVTLVLLLIFLSNQFVHYLGTAAVGKLSSTVLWSLILIEIPHLLGLLIPLCFFLAILLAYGRLYVDGEMGAFIACGLDKFLLLKMTFLMGVIVTLFVGVLSLWLNPKILAYRNELLTRENAETLLATVLPGKFQQLPGGNNRVFYVETLSRDKKFLENVFLSEQYPEKNGSKQSVLFASRGAQVRDPTTKHLFLVLYDGYRYLGIVGQKEYQIIHFKSFGLRLDRQVTQFIRVQQDSMPTFALWKDKVNRSANLAELEWRIALPISVLLLTLLAFLLSEVKPRQGRYAKLIPAVLIYTVYANLLFVMRSWIAQDLISPAIGMWWVHGVFALVLCLFLYFNYRPRFFFRGLT
jgi:lipopolysaccharide export system permease protein